MGRVIATAALCAALMAGSARAEAIEITAQSAIGVLTGTLERAENQVAAALILPGSGPTDRDGNTAVAGVTAQPYRLLSQALAAQGISTARVDKRGIGGSTGAPVDPSFAEYSDDARAWIDVILAETGAECVWLLGHSEGSLISMLTADDPEVCGLVLLTPPGRLIADIFHDQIRAQPEIAPHLATFQAAVAALMADQEPQADGLPDNLRLMFMPQSRPLIRDLLSFDPAAALAATDVPTHIIHGDGGFQTPVQEAIPLRAARPDAVAHVLSGMTHMLKTATPFAQAASPDAWVQASLATYSNPNLPLHRDLVPLITAFVTGSAAAPAPARVDSK